MTNKKWFTMKHHGWGWVPISWEGWAVTLGWIGFMIYIATGIERGTDNMREFYTYLILSGAAFLYIVRQKGPWPRWRWDKN